MLLVLRLWLVCRCCGHGSVLKSFIMSVLLHLVVFFAKNLSLAKSHSDFVAVPLMVASCLISSLWVVKSA